MGKGGKVDQTETDLADDQKLKVYKWQEIKQNKWIVIDNLVYDVSRFSRKHPGGERLMLNHAGQDATDAFTCFHNDMKKVSKYMNPIRIGRVQPESDINPNEERKAELHKDFQNLKALAEKKGLFKANMGFFLLHFMQLIILDLIAAYIIYKSGYANWFTYSLAVACLVIVQAQAGWLQHDFGHLSVFKSNKMNHLVQNIIIGGIMGFSAHWWNYRHYQHHAKPNTIKRDPDIRFGVLYLIGKVIPIEYGKKKIGKLPYNLQQFYFFFTLPPLLIPIYFVIETVYFLIKKRKLHEIMWISIYLLRWYAMFVPTLGFIGTVKLYFLVRFFESFWFVWSTQISHLPMTVDYDKDLSWFRSQLNSTCNVEQSAFNDWVSGHLNFQIEHHLFPTMPRHNYYKIAPDVRELCKKYNIDYQCKTMSQATIDIYKCLKESGEMWYEAYNM
uniref:Delta-5 desaturase 3 n=1 Tax=Brachionus koreanus TaxID=1199090 RepID=A0A291LM83_9BILA|nr:delta-5 desaturase 3 [Brachionus koreanus]QBO56254.1 fatty acid desaturase 5/6-3 [Brachionus koreanus]